jgi:hypothetical protein
LPLAAASLNNTPRTSIDTGVAKFNASPKQVAQTGVLELQAQPNPYDKPVRRKSFFRRALSTFTGGKSQAEEAPAPKSSEPLPPSDVDDGKSKRRRSFASLRRRASGKGRKSVDLSKSASVADKAKTMAKSQRLVARHGTNGSELEENEGVSSGDLSSYSSLTHHWLLQLSLISFINGLDSLSTMKVVSPCCSTLPL